MREAKEFLAHLMPKDSARVVGLSISGDLGAGKQLRKRYCRECLASRDTSGQHLFFKIYPISASPRLPTPTFRSLVHIDAYRFESAEELTKIGWAETLQEAGTPCSY